eukprot:TRINITY_DN34210_c0_g1_i1.p1 TRINITY_DN34210_c0_g1~~TRINITY_DN34210_c0_g1_i1.p1  ORF type:complete len:565 (-),score=120.14 TRINITY_DN34210_c0_g1_i1:585-2279(-)
MWRAQELQPADAEKLLNLNLTQWRAAEPWHGLVTLVADVVKTWDKHLFSSLVFDRSGIVVGRDVGAKFLAEACGPLWNATCRFVDASTIKASDALTPLSNPVLAALGRQTPVQFAIYLSVGRPGHWSQPLNQHGNGDMLLTRLLHAVAPWVVFAELGAAEGGDAVILDTSPSGEQRLSTLSSFASCTTTMCNTGSRTHLRTQGFTIFGQNQWVHRSDRWRIGKDEYLSYWGCGGCSSGLPGLHVRPHVGSLQRRGSDSGIPTARLLDTATPIKPQDANVILSYPGSGQSLLRLMLELSSGLPTTSLYELSLGFHAPLCSCFARAGVLADVSCTGRPVAMTHHNEDFLRLVDTESMSSLTFVLRDYKQILKRLISPTLEGEAREHALRRFTLEYMVLLDMFERFQGPKKIIYLDDLAKQPAEVLRSLLELLDVEGAAAGVERWAASGDGAQEEIAAWCAGAAEGEVEEACVAPCRNFMKARRKGPFAAMAASTADGGAASAAWWHQQLDDLMAGEVLSEEALWEVTEEFEQFVCVYMEVLETRELAKKYLLQPGWGVNAAAHCLS